MYPAVSGERTGARFMGGPSAGGALPMSVVYCQGPCGPFALG